MTADRFSPIADDDPDGPSRLRQVITALFVLLFTVFLFEAMDGVQRAAELAERRENVLRAACRDPAWDIAAADLAAADEDDQAATQPAAELGAPQLPATDPVTPAHFAPDVPAPR